MSHTRSLTATQLNPEIHRKHSNTVIATSQYREKTASPTTGLRKRRPSTATTLATTTPTLSDSGQQQSPVTTISLSPSPKKQATSSNMAYQNSTQPTAMYVRALYDYDSDDRTSLSFKQGDIIQVITQLESGWWDGVTNDVRGWFPSNYCAVVEADTLPTSGDEQSMESGTEDEYEEMRPLRSVVTTQENLLSFDSTRDQDAEAAFWSPQITNDGRLYYFNTLTGESARELPLETPTQGESGPRDRMIVRIPDQTRPPTEMMAGGYYDKDDGETSASELEEATRPRYRRRRSQLSDGMSPSASTESLAINASPTNKPNRARSDTIGAYCAGVLLGHGTIAIPRNFNDDGIIQPITWNRLVENIRKSVESYRQAINNAERSEYVRKAEDISDNLRMILAAGSGTTDNHSGNPSVISTNKTLYPHFRDMMSRFSKLVLSSHMAAADWPAPDSYAKCLQEAEGVLQGVYGFVEVARSQQGENVPRLVPGFVTGGNVGGNWQNHGLVAPNENEDQDSNEPAIPLDGFVIERMDDLKRMIVSSIRRLEEHLFIQEKTVTITRHEQISNTVSTAAGKVVEYYKPYVSTLEATNLSANTTGTSPQFLDLMAQKQRLYDLVAELVVAVQAVAAPLDDEWASVRGEPLGVRMQEVQAITKDLEKCMSEISFILQQMLQLAKHDNPVKPHSQTLEGGLEHPGASYLRSPSRKLPKNQFNDTNPSVSLHDGIEPTQDHSINPKVKKFFGEVPVVNQPLGDEVPWYLKLDYENELAYENKGDPPQLKGGTLAALIEQLTRHDRPDTTFNSTFLLTYRSFTTASELFDSLVRRFSIQPPRGINQEEYRNWIEKKQAYIRIRVVNVLKTWLDTYWMEEKDAESSALLSRIYTFSKDTIAKSTTPGSGPLLTVVEQRTRGLERPKKLVVNTGQVAPTPIIPKNMKRLKFLDIDVTEFARQLTIIESNLYGKIKPTECLNKTWHKKDEPDVAPNIKALILHSNQLTNWVAELILTQSDVKKRVVVIKHFISVADKCRSLNNFSTLTSIISALGTAPIHRLNRTWAQVSARTSATLEQMRTLMHSTKNFKEYRPALNQANPPCIPFFGTSFLRIPGLILFT